MFFLKRYNFENYSIHTKYLPGCLPANPASGEYVFGSPVFDEVSIQLPDNKKMIIKTVNNAKDHPYIQSVTLNGKPYSKTYITHALLMEGGTLEFVMSAQPNKEYGADPSTWPASMN